MGKGQPTNSKIYKIFSDNGLIYIGKTKGSLDDKLHDHFFGNSALRKINIECVSRIEYANLFSEANAAVYEIYLINKLRPPLNIKEQTDDVLTIELPPLPFHKLHCEQMEKWKDQIRKTDSYNNKKHELKEQIEEEKRNKQREIFENKDLKTEEKQRLYQKWLLEYYEPIRNTLL